MKKERSLFASVRTFSRKICHSVGQIYSPLTIKVKGPQRKIKAVATAGVLGIATAVTAFSVMGCPSPHDSTKEQPDVYEISDSLLLVNGTTIWKESKVDQGKFDSFVASFNSDYSDSFNIPMKTSFDANVVDIYIKSGTGISYKDKKLTFGVDENYSSVLQYLVDENLLLLAHNQQKSTIRLADRFDNSKETVRLAMGKSKLEKMA